MNLTTADLAELAEIAVQAAAEAGTMISRSRPTKVEHKASGDSLGAQVVTEIDRASEAIILDALQPTLDRFELGLLSEETPDDGGRLAADHFWCIDPLDGTLPFIEGNVGYSVSIALVRKDGTPLVGAVCDPVEGTVFHAIDGVGAFRNDAALRIAPDPNADTLSVFASHRFAKTDNHRDMIDGIEAIARERGLLGVNVSTSSGAVMKACDALATAPALYFTTPVATGASLWDFAATACLFQAAGGVVTDMWGRPLDLNRGDSTYANHRGAIYATDASLSEALQTLWRRVAGGR